MRLHSPQGRSFGVRPANCGKNHEQTRIRTNPERKADYNLGWEKSFCVLFRFEALFGIIIGIK
jgi:hypothetical protein